MSYDTRKKIVCTSVWKFVHITDTDTKKQRDYATAFSTILTRLFQRSIDDGKIPSDWWKASIVPIYKKGDKHKAANYRPVSLTSISCKLLEHITHSNIMDHYDSLWILADK